MRTRNRSFTGGLKLVAVLLLTLWWSAGAEPNPPSWWSTRQVVDPQQTPNDYAPVNQGQLKNIAAAAMQELDLHAPGGAGPAVHALVDPWAAPGTRTNDYAPVNIGQLKAVAMKFYNRLTALGYASGPPWPAASAATNDFAPANIGQVKRLFAFDYAAFVFSDGASLPPPANLTVGSPTSHSLTLHWQASGVPADATYFLEWQDPARLSWSLLCRFPSSAGLYYYDNGLAPSTTYHYRLRYSSHTVFSAYSNIAQGRTLPSNPVTSGGGDASGGLGGSGTGGPGGSAGPGTPWNPGDPGNPDDPGASGGDNSPDSQAVSTLAGDIHVTKEPAGAFSEDLLHDHVYWDMQTSGGSVGRWLLQRADGDAGAWSTLQTVQAQGDHSDTVQYACLHYRYRILASFTDGTDAASATAVYLVPVIKEIQTNRSVSQLSHIGFYSCDGSFGDYLSDHENLVGLNPGDPNKDSMVTLDAVQHTVHTVIKRWYTPDPSDSTIEPYAETEDQTLTFNRDGSGMFTGTAEGAFVGNYTDYSIYTHETAQMLAYPPAPLLTGEGSVGPELWYQGNFAGDATASATRYDGTKLSGAFTETGEDWVATAKEELEPGDEELLPLSPVGVFSPYTAGRGAPPLAYKYTTTTYTNDGGSQIGAVSDFISSAEKVALLRANLPALPGDFHGPCPPVSDSVFGRFWGEIDLGSPSSFTISTFHETPEDPAVVEYQEMSLGRFRVIYYPIPPAPDVSPAVAITETFTPDRLEDGWVDDGGEQNSAVSIIVPAYGETQSPVFDRDLFGLQTAEGLQTTPHGTVAETVGPLLLDIKLMRPDIATWNDQDELPEGRVVLNDEDVRIRVRLARHFETLDKMLAVPEFRQITLRTSPSNPTGVKYPLSDAACELVSVAESNSQPRDELHLTIPYTKLKTMGLLDAVAGKAWLDDGNADPTQSKNLTDGMAFDTAYPLRLQGKSTRYGDLNAVPPNSPWFDTSFVKAAGAELLVIEFAGSLSKKREIMHQAQVLYLSVEGYHSKGVGIFDGTITRIIVPADVSKYWLAGLHVVIFAGCSVLDINDYNNNYSGTDHTASPGKPWASLGLDTVLGYNYSAPHDNHGTTDIVRFWAAKTGSGANPVASWKDANARNHSWHACAITMTDYFYFDTTKLFGLTAIATWKNIPKVAW